MSCGLHFTGLGDDNGKLTQIKMFLQRQHTTSIPIFHSVLSGHKMVQHGTRDSFQAFNASKEDHNNLSDLIIELELIRLQKRLIIIQKTIWIQNTISN